jgi:lysophospholipase L1-like esterase
MRAVRRLNPPSDGDEAAGWNVHRGDRIDVKGNERTSAVATGERTPAIEVAEAPAHGPKRPRTRVVVRHASHGLVVAGTLLVITIASIAFSLRVTPLQTVSALGQTVGVGTAAPSFSLSGPGEVDLFGQPLPTSVRFLGPVRPKLVLNSITLNQQVAGLFDPTTSGGSAQALGDQLAKGWTRYFVWEIAFVGLGALLLLGVVAGWRRHAWSWKKTLVVIAGGLLFVEAVNVGLIALTATTAPAKLHRVGSLGELVGRDEDAPIAAAPGPALPGVQAVVLGDSTAAGLGNAALPDGTKLDEACGRSLDAYAVHLADVNRWNVRNLACSGATIRSGVLGSQIAGDRTIPAQLAVAKRAVGAGTIIVSVGANDLRWAPMIRLCIAFNECDDKASTLYYQRSLALFTRDYYELLRQLAALPNHPRVVINLYYAPFEATDDCITGLTPAKIEVLLERLAGLNAVLAQGAKTFGYLVAEPDFTGHGACSEQPYVQGLTAAAPFHPNPTGELVIALADERALLGAP